jgi:hypothetical protein
MVFKAMNLQKTFYKTLGMWGVFGFLMLFSMNLPAAPELVSASLRSGFSLRFRTFSWGEVNCTVKNPDNVKHEITLRVLSDNSGQKNVFTDTFVIPAETTIKYRSPVLIENSERYLLETFSDGKKLPKVADSMYLKMISDKTLQIGVVGRNEVNMGAFVQIPEFKNKWKVFSNAFNHSTFPENWIALRHLAALIILDPDLPKYSSRQIRALLDYVAQGGTVIFAWPEAIPEIADSPLADLLPVAHKRFRKIYKLDSIRKLLPGFKGFNASGVTFLESITDGDGVDLLKENDLPVIRWKKYGLGSCRFCAFPLVEDAYISKDDWRDMLKLFFINQKLYSETESSRIGLDRMTGFSVPGADIVRFTLLIYFILLGVIIVLGRITRKSGWAWAFAGVMAVAFTLYVLHKAKSSSEHKGRIISVIGLKIEGDGYSVPLEEYCSFFSDANTTIDLVLNDENSVLGGISPDEGSIMVAGMAIVTSDKSNRKVASGIKISNKLDIQRDEGYQKFKGLNLSANSTRQFVHTGSLNASENKSFLRPELIYQENEIKLLPWKIPEGIKFDKAYLLFVNGTMALKKDNGYLKLVSSDKAEFESDEVLRGIIDMLTDNFKKTSPCIALIGKLEKLPFEIEGPIEKQGRSVNIYPVVESCQAQTVLIDSSQIVLTPGEPSTRMYMQGNTLKARVDPRGACQMAFKFTLPPVFASIDPSEIIVNLSYGNSGGNITVEPFIAPDASAPVFSSGGGPKVPPVKGVKKRSGEYVFSGKQLSASIDKFTGSGIVIIDAREKDRSMAPMQKQHANKWKLEDLKVTVKGQLKSSMLPFKY